MATKTTTTSAVAWRPDVTTFAPGDVVPEALINQCTTLGGTINGDAPSVRVAYVTDDAATVTVEGAAITEADPQLSEAVAYTAKITQLVKLSNEQYSQAGTAQQIAASVGRALVRKADALLTSQAAPTSPAVAPVAGLLNTTGIVSGGTVTGSLDTLVDLLAALGSNGATPSHIVVDPLGWANLRKLRTQTGSNQSLVGAGVQDALPVLLSLPVLVNNNMPARTGLVIDNTAVISASGSIQISTSTDRYFEADSTAVRATWRIGHVVPRPNRIAKFTVPNPS